MNSIAESTFGFGPEVPKERVTLGVPTITTDHSFIHEGVAFTASGAIEVVTKKTAAFQLSPPAAVAAAVTINMTNANADLTYTAVTAGTAGNQLGVKHLDPGAASQALSVSYDADEKTVTVNLATDGAGAITSTAAQVKAAVNAVPAIAAVMTCEDEGAGGGVVNATVRTSLTGGSAAVYAHFKPASFTALGGPVTVKLLEDNSFEAAGTAFVPRNRKRSGTITASRITCKYIADATVVPGAGSLELEALYLPTTTQGQSKLGGSSPATEEWILKPGTVYLITMYNDAASTSTVGYDLFWYEEAGA